MFSLITRRIATLSAAAVAVDVGVHTHPDTWIQRKEGTELVRCNGYCRLPNGDSLGKVSVYKDVICERVDQKRMNWDVDGDHECMSFQFKLDTNSSAIDDKHHDMSKYHWIQFIRRHKTDSEGIAMQHIMNPSPAIYHYRDEWYLNVPRTRDILNQTVFYEKYGLHNKSDDELTIFVNPKGWFDSEQHSELTIELDTYLVVEIDTNQHDPERKYCVLFRVNCKKQYDNANPKGRFVNIESNTINYMMNPMQSDQQWMAGYSTMYSKRKDTQHAVLVNNPMITKMDAVFMS
eukprot:6582_1